MRRVFAITIMAVAAFVCARAQGRDGVAIERYSMERVGDSLRIDIRFNTSALKIKNREVAVITPAIVKSNERVMLRSCGIYSRMRDIYYNRNEHLAAPRIVFAISYGSQSVLVCLSLRGARCALTPRA